jgi:hypothetical protein
MNEENEVIKGVIKRLEAFHKEFVNIVENTKFDSLDPIGTM